MRDDSPKVAHRKALVVTGTSAILDSVVEVNIGKSTDAYKDYLGSYEVPSLLIPTLNTLIGALPAMPQLHTIQLYNIIRISIPSFLLLTPFTSPFGLYNCRK